MFPIKQDHGLINGPALIHIQWLQNPTKTNSVEKKRHCHTFLLEKEAGHQEIIFGTYRNKMTYPASDNVASSSVNITERVTGKSF